MTETAKKPIIEMQIDVVPNPTKFNENISNLRKDKILDTDPNTYKNAAAEFVNLAAGKTDIRDFIQKYPKLVEPVAMFKIADNEIHLNGGSTLIANINGIDASKYARLSVIENLAEDIAEGKYPIINLKKSESMATAFINANTPEEQEKAVKTYNQLGPAFEFAAAMKTITNQDVAASVKDQIAKGEVPQMTDQLRHLVAHAEKINNQPEQINNYRLHPMNEPGR